MRNNINKSKKHRAGDTGGGDRHPHQIGTDFTRARVVWF